MFAALCTFSRRAPRACNAALDALSSPYCAAVPSASTQACAAWAGASAHHQWPAHSAAEAALWTRLCSTHVSGEGAFAGASLPSSAGPRLPDSSAAWQALKQRSDAVGEHLRSSVWPPAADSYGELRSALRHGGNEQRRHMATARGPSAVPLQTARVMHAPIALDGHGDAPAARPAAAARAPPAGRHAEHPFPVKAFYIGAAPAPSRPPKPWHDGTIGAAQMSSPCLRVAGRLSTRRCAARWQSRRAELVQGAPLVQNQRVLHCRWSLI